MMWSTVKAAATGAALLLAAGCAQVPPPLVQCDFAPLVAGAAPPPAGPVLAPMVAGTMRDIPLNTVSIIDGDLRGRLMVQNVAASRTSTGDIDVGARIVNCGDEALLVEGRTNFLDAAQRQAEPPSAWQRLVIDGRSSAEYREVSVSGARADAYLVELRGGW